MPEYLCCRHCRRDGDEICLYVQRWGKHHTACPDCDVKTRRRKVNVKPLPDTAA